MGVAEGGTEGRRDGRVDSGWPERDRAGERESGRERERSERAGRDQSIDREGSIERLVGQKGEGIDRLMDWSVG